MTTKELRSSILRYSEMIGRTISHYEIVEKIGEGGMGAVYRAHDTRLGRSVAIKIVNAEFTKRFEREARAIAAINHPHICTLYDVGEHEGAPYLVMEYVEGKPLKGPLPFGEALRYAIQTAQALAAAHKAGIVHRDLKPDNILLTSEGSVKVLDFGLAKLQPAVNTEGPTLTTMTEQGAIAGTGPYMSPEQAQGELVDARSDIFSFGAVLYELLSGRRAFRGESIGATLAAVIALEPPPLPEAPPEIARIVGKMLAKKRESRYQSVEELLADLDTAAQPAAWAISRRLWVAVATALLLVFVTTLWLIQRPKRLETKAISPTTPSEVGSIAVLPFADLSANRDQEYFSDGLADELLNGLTKIPGLRVTARTSSFQFRGKSEDLRVIGRKLNVASVLEGSVRKDGERVRISVQLIDAHDGFHIWSETYERQLDDIFVVQEEIARSVAGALKITLLDRNASVSSPQTKDVEAYNANLQGLYFFGRRNKEDLEKAISYYKSAIQRDSKYAAPWVGLAEAHHRQADNGHIPMDEGYRMARQEVERALALDKDLAVAHAELGWIKTAHDWDWEGAGASYQRALTLDPGNVTVLIGAAALAFSRGRLDEAIELDRRVVRLNPLSVPTHNNLGLYAYYAGRLDEAAMALKKALELNPAFPGVHVLLGRVHLERLQPQQALSEMELETDPVWRQFGLCLAYDAVGRKTDANATLTSFISSHGETMTYQIAEVFAYRGEVERAFEWLGRAYRLRDSGMADIKGDPLLRSLERDARYSALLKKMRL